jgi:hypothetical protein
MSETQQSITAWQRETFGETTFEAAYERAWKEIVEMDGAAADDHRHLVAKELPDVYITLCRVAEKLGVDLHAAVDAKMAVNRARLWVVDDTGNGQHVPEVAPPPSAADEVRRHGSEEWMRSAEKEAAEATTRERVARAASEAIKARCSAEGGRCHCRELREELNADLGEKDARLSFVPGVDPRLADAVFATPEAGAQWSGNVFSASHGERQVLVAPPAEPTYTHAEVTSALVNAFECGMRDYQCPDETVEEVWDIVRVALDGLKPGVVPIGCAPGDQDWRRPMTLGQLRGEVRELADAIAHPYSPMRLEPGALSAHLRTLAGGR